MVRYGMLSDQGNRSNNEDSIGMAQNGNAYCFILADGLGGHGKGEVASKIAVDTATDLFSRTQDMQMFADQAFLAAQKEVMDGQVKDSACKDMKTTMVLLEVQEDFVGWGHIGDSRLYYFKKGKIQERTLDHSVPQMLVSIGEIKEKEIRHHPDRNRLLKVIGVEVDELNYQLSDPVEREPKQAFLMCSDGFWELIDEKKMESTLKHAASPDEWLSKMQEIVLKNGRNTNMDNYSAIAVWLD